MKKKMTTYVTFFDGFVAQNGTCAFCGFVAKNVMATMSSPSSMVMVWWRRRWLEVFLFFFSSAFGLVH